MYAMLAMYEAKLAKAYLIIDQLGEAQEDIDNLKKITANTIVVDGKPYKEDMLDSAIGSLGSAISYIQGTVIPPIQKKIEELKEEIRRYEEEQERLAEEALKNAQNS